MGIPRVRLTACSFGLTAVLALVVAVRVSAIGVGAPFITIDDNTAFEGGFLVWFVHAPPQRMYLESWLYGLVCIAVYVWRSIFSGIGALDVDLIARAYRDYFNNPDPYVEAYRAFTLVLDLATIVLVYRIALRALGQRWGGWAAVCVAALYALSYNTLWSGVVSRPDSVLAFFSSLGLLFYLKSDAGRQQSFFLASTVTLGIAAGMKLHGALTSVLLCVDLVRVHGVRNGWRRVLSLAVISGFFFCVAAGSPLFDPLLYVKLRMLNYVDDRSLWIHWSDHFLTLLRGAGWLGLVLAVPGAAYVLARRRTEETNGALLCVAIVAAGWFILFLITRQLRAYWMLPALPVFYILGVYAATAFERRIWGVLATGSLLAVVAMQYAAQLHEIKTARYGELRDWATANARGRPFFILGFGALILPRDTACIQLTRQVLQHSIDRDLADGLPFTLRHAKNWEETSALALLDMLDDRNEPGFEFYDYFTTPPAELARYTSLERMQFFVVQDRFDLSEVPQIKDALAHSYRQVGEVYGSGGGPQGLKYTIYERR